MEGWVKCLSLQNTSGVSEVNFVAAESDTKRTKDNSRKPLSIFLSIQFVFISSNNHKWILNKDMLSLFVWRQSYKR